MAEPKNGIPVGSKTAFYNWVKQQYPGWWPSDRDMDKIDWGAGRYLEIYKAWVEAGKVATPLPPGQEQMPVPKGAAPPAEITFTSWYGGRMLRGSDGKFYDPEDRTVELSPEEVDFRYRLYLADVNRLQNPNAPTPTDILNRERFDLEKWEKQTERERQEAEGRNKAWVLQNESQRMQSETAIEKQRNELELIKGRSFPFGDEAGRRRAFQEATAGAFESARQSILASLSSPSDWIKRWDVQNAPNPYTPQPVSATEQAQSQLSNTETRAKMFDQMADESEKLVNTLANDPSYGVGPNSPIEAGVLTQARADVANYRNAANAERGNLPAYQSDVTYLQGQPQPVPSQLGGRGSAPAPGWLPMFAPGQQAGRPITRENVATPSAQQWSSTPWSVQQGLSGYLDWAGYRPMADVLGNMAQMLPNAPGGGSRWSPYIGR